MKFFSFLCAIALAVSCTLGAQIQNQEDQVMLALDSPNNNTLTHMFHMTPLNASGSGQFSEKGLEAMLAVIPSNQIMVVDLREESHGFLNGNAVGWFTEKNWINAGLSKEEIIEVESRLLSDLSKQSSVILYIEREYPTVYEVSEVMSEEKLTARYGVAYYRLPVQDHVRPTDATVDTFVNFMKNLNPDIWLHFHCRGGKGRTTTFLVMLDIMQNAQTDVLEDIIKRQHLYGGKDLFKDPEKGEWKDPLVLERIEFLKAFHRYARECPDFSIPWTEWVRVAA